jgi:DNA-binding CsgD family transcriptional regulator
MREDFASCGAPGGSASACSAKEDFLEVLRATPLRDLNARLAALTTQERIILELIARGQCNKDICRALGIEITTAKVHASRIFKKLRVKNRVQAAVFQLWALLLTEHAAQIDPQPMKPAGPRAASRSDAAGERPLVLHCEAQ